MTSKDKKKNKLKIKKVTCLLVMDKSTLIINQRVCTASY